MLDPRLCELLRAGSERDREIEAIIRLRSPDVDVPGVRIVARFGQIATCRLRTGSIRSVRRDDNVLSLKAAGALGAEVGRAEPGPAPSLPLAAFAADARRPDSELTGAGVVCGFADWGCDFDHPNFKRADGSTRLLALWDQRPSGAGPAPQPYGYGRVYGRAEIDAALRSGDPYAALGYHPADADRDCSGAHCTHVMDIAAGNGRAGGPVGIAPEAALVVVHLTAHGTGGLANLGDSARLLEAAHFMASTAGERPWVINLSVGRCGGPHDGCTLTELALDELLSAAPGRCICQSAGNYFDKSIHASGRLEAGQARSLTVITQDADLTPNELEVWYSGEDELRVMLESPTGARSQWVALAGQAEILEGDQLVGRIYHRDCDPNNHDNHIEIFLDPWAPAGAWIVTLHALTARDGAFHAWLERDEACPDCQARFDPADADSSYTTGTIANGRLPLVVGAYDAHSPAAGPAAFSSAGPTRDGRPGPDLLAPGKAVVAARSAPHGSSASPGAHTQKTGTSMATPHVTGVAALCLQGARRPIAIDELRRLILDSAQRDSSARTPSPRSGWGRLDIAEVLRAISAREPSAAPRRPPSGRANGNQRDDDRRGPAMTPDLEQAEQIHFDPDTVYRAIVYRRDGPTSAWIDDTYAVVARPGEAPSSPPAAGDVLVRVALGQPGLGHVAVLAGSAVRPPAALDGAPVRSERGGPGAYAVVVDRDSAAGARKEPIARRLLDRAGRMPVGQLLLRSKRAAPTDGDALLPEGDEYEQTLARIRQELALRFTDRDDPPLPERLRALFASVPPQRTRELHDRLETQATSDELSQAFHARLATPTRTELLNILRHRFPAATPSSPPPQPAKGSPGQRGPGSMTGLLPWERTLLAIANDTPESALDSVAVLIGPVLLPGQIASFRETIVRTALQHAHPVTIENNIWFPSPLDTTTVADLTLLVHESVHALDYATAGTEAYLKTYATQAAIAGFSHDDIPHEQRANSLEAATRRMLNRFPQLTDLIASSDSAAIVAELRRGRDTYRAAINQLLDDAAPTAGAETATQAAPDIDSSVPHPQLGPPAAEQARDDAEDAPPRSVRVELRRAPPPSRPAVDRATPRNRPLAEEIDAVERLKDTDLLGRRDQVTLQAMAAPSEHEQKRLLQTLDAIEFVASQRGLPPPKPDWSKYQDIRAKTAQRRVYWRARIEEGIRKTGSFEKALNPAPGRAAPGLRPSLETEGDIRAFERERDRFAKEFESQAKWTAERMVLGSIEAMRKVVDSYGLPVLHAMSAADSIARGASVETEAEDVVKRATYFDNVDAPANEKRRELLAQWVGRLKKHQRRVAALEKLKWQAATAGPIYGPVAEAARKATAELVAAQHELATMWIRAERAHPVLAAYRLGEPLEKINLGTLDTDPVNQQMKAVLVRVLPKLAHALRALDLIRETGEERLSALTLPAVVALTRANMFIPEGSIRAGIVNDLVETERGKRESPWMMLASLALALITLLPSGGASLLIPAGMAAAGLAAYEAVEAIGRYERQKTLVDTDLDKARSLSDEEPSLTGFAMSLVNLGLEGLPLIGAFAKAVEIRRLVSRGENTAHAVGELNRIGAEKGAQDLGKRALAEAHATQPAAKSAAKAPDPPAPAPPAPKPPPAAPPPPTPQHRPGQQHQKMPVPGQRLQEPPAPKPPSLPAQPPHQHQTPQQQQQQQQGKLPSPPVAKPPPPAGQPPTPAKPTLTAQHKPTGTPGYAAPKAPKVTTRDARLTPDARTAGTGGISHIHYNLTPSNQVEVMIKGRLRPRVAERREDWAPNYNKESIWGKLREGHKVPDWEAAHLWGPGFGDEAAAGIMLAPKEVNQVWQNRGVEKFLRELRDEAGKLGGEVELKAVATSQVRTIEGGAGDSFLAHVQYEYSIVAPGKAPKQFGYVEFSVGKPPTGKVSEPFISKAGAGATR